MANSFNIKAMVWDKGIEWPNDCFKVVTYAYTGDIRQWCHRTLKAAHRRLGSAINGKLEVRGEYAAIILCPDGNVMNYNEARDKIR